MQFTLLHLNENQNNRESNDASGVEHEYTSNILSSVHPLARTIYVINEERDKSKAFVEIRP